jgi:hypothetical protein
MRENREMQLSPDGENLGLALFDLASPTRLLNKEFGSYENALLKGAEDQLRSFQNGGRSTNGAWALRVDNGPAPNARPRPSLARFRMFADDSRRENTCHQQRQEASRLQGCLRPEWTVWRAWWKRGWGE